MKKKLSIQNIFCFSSLIFILTCIFWYGGRFIYFYLENQEQLKQNNKIFYSIVKDNNLNSENFKKINKTYYFTGNTNNNYVNYSNLLWRIVKVNEDNTILLVTNNVIGTIAYGDINTPYEESNLINWLNNNETGKLIKILNNKEKYLNITNTCIDTITNIENITCDNIDNNHYIGLLSIEDYLNTGGNNSFINANKYTYLSNKNNENKIWYITDKGKLNTTDGDNILGIKATITLSSTTELISGNGTIEEPYKFEDTNQLIGSYVKLDNDLWRIYEEKDNIIKLVLESSLMTNNEPVKHSYSNNTYYYDDSIKNSLAYYLNNDYYNSLSYKELIIKNNYPNGMYGKEDNYKYENIINKTIETKITIPSIDDIIFNDNINNYFTSTGKTENQEAIYIKELDGTASTKLTRTTWNIVPCISINKEKLISGTGEYNNPYRTE